MAHACILGTILISCWQQGDVTIHSSLTQDTKLLCISVYQLLISTSISWVVRSRLGESLDTWGMRHLLEPDRPGYVPSVSFLRPDRSEERGPLQIGIFDSASRQDSELQWQRCQKRNKLINLKIHRSEWQKMLKSTEKFAKAPPHGYFPNQSLDTVLRKGQSSPDKSLEPIQLEQLEPNRYVKKKSLRENYII